MKLSFLPTLAASAAIFLSNAALADEQVKKPPPEYHLSLTPAQLQVVGQALSQMPYRDVAPLLGELQKQMDGQMIPDPNPPAPVVTAPAK